MQFFETCRICCFVLLLIVSNAKIEKDIAKLTTSRSTYRSRINFDNIKNIVTYIYNIEYFVAMLDRFMFIALE